MSSQEGRAPDYDELPEKRVTINQVVAYNITYFRKERGLTQEQLGRRMERVTGKKWSKATMSAAERSWEGVRIRQFDADEIFAFSTALGYPVPAFFLPPTGDGIEVKYMFKHMGPVPLYDHQAMPTDVPYGSASDLLDMVFYSEIESKYPEDHAYIERLFEAFNFYFGVSPEEGEAFFYHRPVREFVDEGERKQEQMQSLRRQMAAVREVLGMLERAAEKVANDPDARER